MTGPTTAPQLSMGLTSFSAEALKDWDSLLDHARLYDRAGVDRLLVSDHIAFGERLEEYGRPEVGGVSGGRQPTGPDGHWLEPMTVLSAVSSVTSRVRLGTNILQAALRRPAVLAKSAATLDVLSKGRLDLGVGVGWQREEYEAAGLDFEGRGKLLDHTLAVCRTLWREQRADFADDRLRFEAVHQMPKPVQPGGVPVWVSGTVNRAVARRLARFGSGWIPWGPAAADIREGIAQMRRAVAEFGREDWDIQVVGTLPVRCSDDGRPDAGATFAQVPALVEAGVTDVRVPWKAADDLDQAADELAAFVAAFRAAAK
ncbi:TIGR03619 family F420-dependent LLM class oxidoreductase [Yinghuangia sp. YIM S09857]|uniref:TIGR03619 family F420-dependent LLM class oxidoreductase n=1 Tax=Yinghuangia sp. YIM S09857 TaxID=3436929 RepID=UPI003F52CE5E